LRKCKKTTQGFSGIVYAQSDCRPAGFDFILCQPEAPNQSPLFQKGMNFMHKHIVMALFGVALLLGANLAQTPQTEAPNINGEWAGTWGVYSPAQGTTPPQNICKTLLARVERKDDVWLAHFEGDCGRPYKYAIKMEGRQAGKSVMFKGTVDLGPKDGGVFDWIGKANDKEFVGFFTSAGYTGTFALTRPESKPAAKEPKQ
jgi:hypothetical protein